MEKNPYTPSSRATLGRNGDVLMVKIRRYHQILQFYAFQGNKIVRETEGYRCPL